MVVYHYTSKSSFDQILASGTLLRSSPALMRSNPWTTMDSAYGDGWYFTDLPPDKCDAWTVAHCWRSVSAFNKVENYLKFEIPEGILKHCRDHVYMLSTWDQRIRYLEGKATPRCPKAPCILCEAIARVKAFFGLK